MTYKRPCRTRQETRQYQHLHILACFSFCTWDALHFNVGPFLVFFFLFGSLSPNLPSRPALGPGDGGPLYAFFASFLDSLLCLST